MIFNDKLQVKRLDFLILQIFTNPVFFFEYVIFIFKKIGGDEKVFWIL
jgi:hypothetical protein